MVSTSYFLDSEAYAGTGDARQVIGPYLPALYWLRA